MYKHILVPIDGTPLSTLTVEQAVAFARDARARLTFLHVQADVGATSEAALLRAMSPADVSTLVDPGPPAYLARAAATAHANKIAFQTVTAVGNRPHEAIHTAAIAHGCDLIFMASHGRRGLFARWAGSETMKLLARTTLPLLVARVESNVTLTAQQRAVTVILDEHRSLSAVIRALQSALSLPGPVEHQLLQAGLYYLREFPERLHHRREEETLFSRLRQRTDDCRETIDSLERQHRDGARDFSSLLAAYTAFETRGEAERPAFTQALSAYAELQWSHMAVEERQLLPMAAQSLQDSDWECIAEAFEAHDSAGPDEQVVIGFARVFERLMSMAAQAAEPG